VIAFALSGFLLYVCRRGLGAPSQYRDPVCGMRTDEAGPSVTHDGETCHFCSKSCKRAFEDDPRGFAQEHTPIADADSSQSHDHH
jgi:YHS domain-containing protein